MVNNAELIDMTVKKYLLNLRILRHLLKQDLISKEVYEKSSVQIYNLYIKQKNKN